MDGTPHVEEPSPLRWALSVAASAGLAGMLCFYTGLARIGPSRAAMLSNCEPVFVLLLAMMLLGETFTVQQSIGALLVIVFMLLYYRLFGVFANIAILDPLEASFFAIDKPIPRLPPVIITFFPLN